jgi:O-antigen biosynthesis protein WbqP
VPWTKRVFDVLAAVLLLLVLLPLFVVLALLIKAASNGPAVYWSDRVGKDNRIFRMPKFRSMRIDTPQLPTHLLSDPAIYLTPIGRFLRRTSLDELPQLFSILGGDLSVVGPRPSLFNQDDLISLRTERGIHVLVPGLTGWARVRRTFRLTVGSTRPCCGCIAGLSGSRFSGPPSMDARQFEPHARRHQTPRSRMRICRTGHGEARICTMR